MKVPKSDRQRAIDRIKKCLALSESPEPAEAAAALRQAQKLMNTLGLTEADVLAGSIEAEVVKTKEAFGGCRYMARLTHLIQQSFAVIAIWEPGSGISRIRANIRYVGPAARVALAVYAHRVVVRAIAHAWRDHLNWNPELQQKPGSRAAFREGFLTAIAHKITALAPTTDEFRAINCYLQMKYGTGLEEKTDKARGKLDFDAYCAGAVRGADMDLLKPMEEQTPELEWKPE